MSSHQVTTNKNVSYATAGLPNMNDICICSFYKFLSERAGDLEGTFPCINSNVPEQPFSLGSMSEDSGNSALLLQASA